jgi:dephospho-CoA kinase
MLKVGLTGSIGSGKSLVGNMFQVLGVPVFDADTEAKKLYQLTEVREQLAEIAGDDIFLSDGQVDRKKLASILFNNPRQLQQVNLLIHPLVRKSFASHAVTSAGYPYIIYEAAILVESGYYRELDKLIVVHAPEDIRLQRVMLRDSASETEVRNRMRAQVSDEERLKVADFIIYNDGSRLVIPQVVEIDRILRVK